MLTPGISLIIVKHKATYTITALREVTKPLDTLNLLKTLNYVQISELLNYTYKHIYKETDLKRARFYGTSAGSVLASYPQTLVGAPELDNHIYSVNPNLLFIFEDHIWTAYNTEQQELTDQELSKLQNTTLK